VKIWEFTAGDNTDCLKVNINPVGGSQVTVKYVDKDDNGLEIKTIQTDVPQKLQVTLDCSNCDGAPLSRSLRITAFYGEAGVFQRRRQMLTIRTGLSAYCWTTGTAGTLTVALGPSDLLVDADVFVDLTEREVSLLTQAFLAV
jgi:hypothetical protein